jgi:hypothetical protein
MIDVRLVNPSEPSTPSSASEASDADEDDDDEEEEGITEIRYVPDDKSKLGEMFTVGRLLK